MSDKRAISKAMYELGVAMDAIAATDGRLFSLGGTQTSNAAGCTGRERES